LFPLFFFFITFFFFFFFFLLLPSYIEVLQELVVNMVHLVFIDSHVASARAAEMLARIMPAIIADTTAKRATVDGYIEVSLGMAFFFEASVYSCFHVFSFSYFLYHYFGLFFSPFLIHLLHVL
jgi:hypothetical protein